ncbi:MAG: pseudouridine synthase [Pseudomonadota bacterium]
MSDKLQKALAHLGLGSRREIETWISAGRISVNGKRAKLGDRAGAHDRVLLDGKLVQLADTQHQAIKALIYHKPEGQICTRKDPKGRPTIFENLPGIVNARWVAVGRLDLNTSGLILLTNNGELANKLMHPSTGLEREYLVRIRGKASDKTISTLTAEGVMLDNRPARFERVLAADMAQEGTNHWYRVVIKEGRFREVRRMWEAVGHSVSRLKRIRYGTIKLTRDLKQGQHTKVAPKQLEKLVSSVGLAEQFGGQLYSGTHGRSAAKKITAKTGKNRRKPAANMNRNHRSNSGGKPGRRR